MFPIINCCVVVYWLFNQTEKELSFKKHDKLTKAIYITSFFTLYGVLLTGIAEFLFFIPSSWGSYDEDGDWTNMRTYISGILAICGSFLIVDIFEKYGKLTKEIERLEEERFQKEKEHKELREQLEICEEEDGDDYDL